MKSVTKDTNKSKSNKKKSKKVEKKKADTGNNRKMKNTPH